MCDQRMTVIKVCWYISLVSSDSPLEDLGGVSKANSSAAIMILILITMTSNDEVVKILFYFFTGKMIVNIFNQPVYLIF